MVFYTFGQWTGKSRTVFGRLTQREVITLIPEKKTQGEVLLSYLTNPFRFHVTQSHFRSHTNQWECTQIAQAWLNKGYSVDIIDWNNNHFIPKKDYSVLIDIHSNMERLAPLMRADCQKILHITGAHWLFQNTAEYSRLLSLQKRRNMTLIPRRTVQPSMGIEYADCATVLGNSFTQETFAYSKKPLYPIRLSTNLELPFFETKEFGKIRKNYLWFGGGGMVHKGLDLVLETFFELPDFNLTVCGPVNHEPDFQKAYFKELYQTPNIQTIGSIDVHSSQFQRIIRNNVGLIYPSCSEGGGGSVITCLHAGLIPVISYESSVDISGFGIVLAESTINEIITSVKKISGLSDTDLKINSKKSWEYARNNHMREHFIKDYEKFVEIMTSTIRM